MEKDPDAKGLARACPVCNDADDPLIAAAKMKGLASEFSYRRKCKCGAKFSIKFEQRPKLYVTITRIACYLLLISAGLYGIYSVYQVRGQITQMFRNNNINIDVEQ